MVDTGRAVGYEAAMAGTGRAEGKEVIGTGNLRGEWKSYGFVRVYEEYKDGEGVAAGGADASEDPG